MAKHAARKKGPAFKLPRARRQAAAEKAQWDAPYASRGADWRISKALSVTGTDHAGGARDERDREEPLV
jgi:hypothetical protein